MEIYDNILVSKVIPIEEVTVYVFKMLMSSKYFIYEPHKIGFEFQHANKEEYPSDTPISSFIDKLRITQKTSDLYYSSIRKQRV